jgi:beta-lactamase superfamily II metal-dependent hydrolase
MKRIIAITTILIVLFFGARVNADNGEYSIHFIDVGQEDCILIKGQEKSYLIDAARKESSKKVIEYLNKQGVNKLNTVIITHYHDDHYGGLNNILYQKLVDRVILPAHQPQIRDELFSYLTGQNIKVEYAAENFEIKDKDIAIKALLTKTEDLEIENNNSIVLFGKIDGIEYVFASDIEESREREMLKHSELKKCDVLKVPHHGLSTSSSEAFIRTLNPRVMIITSDGVESPEKEVLKTLYKLDGVVFRSDLQGDIVIKGNLDNKAIEITSSKVIK